VNSAVGSRRRNSSGCCAGIQGTCPGDSDRDFSRNSAACTQREGAVFHGCAYGRVYPTRQGLTHVWRRTLGRVARPTQHRAVGDLERGPAEGERDDVVDGEIARRMAGALVARAPVPVLAAPRPKHACAEALPLPRAVQRVVAAAVRLASVRGAATTRPARRNAADRAELQGSHRLSAVPCATLVTLDCTPFDIAASVSEANAAVYSPSVLRPQSQTWARPPPTCPPATAAVGRSMAGRGSWLARPVGRPYQLVATAVNELREGHLDDGQPLALDDRHLGEHLGRGRRCGPRWLSAWPPSRLGVHTTAAHRAMFRGSEVFTRLN
jgi:hypothetical protein